MHLTSKLNKAVVQGVLGISVEKRIFMAPHGVGEAIPSSNMTSGSGQCSAHGTKYHGIRMVQYLNLGTDHSNFLVVRTYHGGSCGIPWYHTKF
jgi:hypothetical protein